MESDGAVVYRNGRGHLHREGGPAVEHKDGSKFWYRDGHLHREDGPAIDRVDGVKEWWLNGRPWPEGLKIFAEHLRQKDIDACRNGLPYDISVDKPFQLKPKRPS